MLSIVIGFASNHFCFVMRRLTNTVQLLCLYIGQSLFVRGSEWWKVSENLATQHQGCARAALALEEAPTVTVSALRSRWKSVCKFLA